MGAARDVAVRVLDRVELQGAFAAAVLEAELEGVSDPREAALASEIVYGVLRSRPWLDRLLEGASDRGLSGIDPTVMNTLRAAAYQIAFLERVPARAAVSEAVKQVKSGRAPRLAGLANALLRKLSRGPREELDPGEGQDGDRLGLPGWLLERISADWGRARAVRMARAFNRHSSRTLRINLSRDAAADLPERFGETGRLLPWYVTVADRAEARRLVAEGLASYQDQGSGLVVAALDPRAGEEILDACAGRGGKTATIAAVTRSDARITASDRKGSKLQRLVFELGREGFEAATEVADMTVPGPPPEGLFDRVLLDAPCSGTGTIGRRPEIRWRLRPQDVDALAAVQGKMLRKAADLVKPGGRLVMATCSVMVRESRGHAASFLAERPDFGMVEEAPAIWPDAVPWEGGMPFVDPGVTESDGYGILCMERRR